MATARGLRPVSVPDFPDTLAAIIDRRLASVTLTIEAALRGDRDLLVEALLADGAVHDPDVASNMADNYLATQAEYLSAVRVSSPTLDTVQRHKSGESASVYSLCPARPSSSSRRRA